MLLAFLILVVVVVLAGLFKRTAKIRENFFPSIGATGGMPPLVMTDTIAVIPGPPLMVLPAPPQPIPQPPPLPAPVPEPAPAKPAPERPAPAPKEAIVEPPKAAPAPAAPAQAKPAPAPTTQKPAPSNKGGITGGADNPKEGVGKTTRYFDCCKPGCGWTETGVATIKSCAMEDPTKILDDVNEGSVCDPNKPGKATTCASNYPWVDTATGIAYGTAASHIYPNKADACGKCYELTFTGQTHNGGDDKLQGKKMIVQVTNNGQVTEYTTGQFDLLIPGGGEGLFHGCSYKMFPGLGKYDTSDTLKNEKGLSDPSTRGKSDVWGLEYGGVETLEGCSKLPAILQEGCKFRFVWGQGTLGNENKVNYKEIPCPAQLTAKTGFKHKDDPGGP